MSFAGVPDELTEKMDRCIQKVMADGKDKSSAIAICKSRIVPDGKRSAGMYQSRPVLSPIRQVADGRYRCYAVRFNGSEDKDAYGTYFDGKTCYYTDYYDKRPWLYDHGLHPLVGRSKIGDWDAIGLDNKGVFVEGELDRHHKYRAKIETLIAEGVLYPSSGALDYLVRVADDGHVEDWPIIEVTSTVRPADWRMLDSISPAARGAMRMLLDDYLTEVEQMDAKDRLRAMLGLRSDEEDTTITDVEEDVSSLDEDTSKVSDNDADGEDGEDDGLDETTRALVETIGTELATIRKAIVGMDDVLKDQDATLKQHGDFLSGLAEDEQARTFRAVTDGDWLGSLYSVTRSVEADEVDEDEAKEITAEASKRDADPNATGWELITGQVQ